MICNNRIIWEGNAQRAAQRAAVVAVKFEAERDRHHVAMQDNAVRRSVATLKSDVVIQAAALTVVAAAAKEEQRNRAKINALQEK